MGDCGTAVLEDGAALPCVSGGFFTGPWQDLRGQPSLQSPRADRVLRDWPSPARVRLAVHEGQAGAGRAEAGDQAGRRCSDPGGGAGHWARVESGVQGSDSTRVCEYSPRGLLKGRTGDGRGTGTPGIAAGAGPERQEEGWRV